MDRSEAARLLGSTPKGRRYERVCSVCGRVFLTTARGVFCSRQCNWRHFNEIRRKGSKPQFAETPGEHTPPVS